MPFSGTEGWSCPPETKGQNSIHPRETRGLECFSDLPEFNQLTRDRAWFSNSLTLEPSLLKHSFLKGMYIHSKNSKQWKKVYSEQEAILQALTLVLNSPFLPCNHSSRRFHHFYALLCWSRIVCRLDLICPHFQGLYPTPSLLWGLSIWAGRNTN